MREANLGERSLDPVPERDPTLAPWSERLTWAIAGQGPPEGPFDRLPGHPVGLSGMLLAQLGPLLDLEAAEGRREYLGSLDRSTERGGVERDGSGELTGRGEPL